MWRASRWPLFAAVLGAGLGCAGELTGAATSDPDLEPDAVAQVGRPNPVAPGVPRAMGADASAGPEGDPGRSDGGASDASVGTGSPDGTSSPDAAVPAAALAPTTSRTFSGTDEDFNNPERGFYRYGEITRATDFGQLYDDGYTLLYSYVRLDAYRDQPIDQALLDDMDSGLNAARAAGVKVILRFAYNFGPYPNSEPDAPRARILAHIEQVRPYLTAHEDVIAAVQAGFIGAWGEWHTSTNGLDNLADKQVVLEALLQATPASRTVHVRYPPDKQGIYGDPGPEASAFDGGPAARTGHHNDCFLSSDTDVGTYPGNEVERWKAYLAQDTKFVPMGGETCALHARGACATAMEEMRRLHYSYLNRDYHPDVIDRWNAEGCYAEIKRSLGYRLSLTRASLPVAARPGGAFLLELELRNTGYAAPFNPRPVQLVLIGSSPGDLQRATIPSLDPRRWLPGDTITLRIRVQLPSQLTPGDYQLGLALPDAASRLADRSAYAIRLANDGVWLPATGANWLSTVRIDSSAAGGARSDAATLTAALAD